MSNVCCTAHFELLVICGTKHSRTSIDNSLIKISYAFYLYKILFLDDTLTSDDIPFKVTSGFIFSTDQSTMSLLNL